MIPPAMLRPLIRQAVRDAVSAPPTRRAELLELLEGECGMAELLELADALEVYAGEIRERCGLPSGRQ